MFDIGWSELLVIAVVALVAIGPKELPGVMRMAGQWIAKARRVASDFQGQFQEALREAEMEDLKKHVDDLNETAQGLNQQFNQLVDSHDEVEAHDEYEAAYPAIQADEPVALEATDEHDLASEHHEGSPEDHDTLPEQHEAEPEHQEPTQTAAATSADGHDAEPVTPGASAEPSGAEATVEVKPAAAAPNAADDAKAAAAVDEPAVADLLPAPKAAAGGHSS